MSTTRSAVCKEYLPIFVHVSKHSKLGSKSQHYRPTSLVYKAIIVKDCLAEYDLNKRRGKGSNLRICKASGYL